MTELRINQQGPECQDCRLEQWPMSGAISEDVRGDYNGPLRRITNVWNRR